MKATLIVIIEYFIISYKKERYFAPLLSILIGCLIFIFFRIEKLEKIFDILGNSLSLIGIFIGFTSAILALLLSSSQENIISLKKVPLKINFLNKNYTLYDDLVLSFTNLIFVYTYLLLSSYILLLIGEKLGYNIVYIFHINIAITVYSILSLISNLINFYLIVSRDKS